MNPIQKIISGRWLFRTKTEILADKKKEEARRERRKLDKELRREAKYFAKLIPDVLAEAGIDHNLPLSQRPTVAQRLFAGLFGLDPGGRQKVHILEVQPTPFAHYLWIDPRDSPYRTRVSDLHTDEILEHLSYACGRQVVWRGDPLHGAWYVIWRDGAINAIPNLFKYAEAVSMIDEKAPPLTFIAGVTENNRLIKTDLAMLPHYLVAGSTFMGKSVHLNQILCLLIQRNTPADLRLMMIDLKDGAEFKYYENLPHLLGPVITRAEDVAPALRDFAAEMRDRRKKISTSAGGPKDLEEYNKLHPGKKLPYIVLVFDELSLIMMHPDRKISKECNLLLNEIMATSRSSGGHAILCTQRPSSNVVPSYITANAGGRICFAVPSNTDSIVVLDNGAASKIDPEIRGRAIFLQGPRLTEIQSPYISNSQIKEIVAAAVGKEPATIDMGVTLDEVLEVAVDQFGGKLDVLKLYSALRGRTTRDHIGELIQGLNGDVLNIHGKEYRFKKGSRGRHGGKELIPVVTGELLPDSSRLPFIGNHRITHEFLFSLSKAEKSERSAAGR